MILTAPCGVNSVLLVLGRAAVETLRPEVLGIRSVKPLEFFPAGNGQAGFPVRGKFAPLEFWICRIRLLSQNQSPRVIRAFTRRSMRSSPGVIPILSLC